jgi:hypothetical protein
MTYYGFDSASYPGDELMQHWYADSPYRFTGYYLTTECHSAAKYTPWMGHWKTLRGIGWGIGIFYVGYQVAKSCRRDVSRDLGISHGNHAISLVGKPTRDFPNAEDFQPGVTVFLDVENPGGDLPPEMIDYCKGWIRALLNDTNYKPGIYCSSTNADQLVLAAQQEFADFGLPGGRPLMWIARYSGTFAVNVSKPEDCGKDYADIWQGAEIKVGENYNGYLLKPLDQNASKTANPSNVELPV